MGRVAHILFLFAVTAAACLALALPSASWAGLLPLTPVTLPAGSIGQPAPQQVAIDTATNVIYASDSVNNTIYAIDGASGSVTAIDVGAPSSAIAVNSATNKIYVGVGGGNPDIVVVDGQTNSVLTKVGIGVEPDSLTVDEADNKVFAAFPNSQSFEAIDGSSDTAVKGLSIGALGSVGYDSKQRVIYATGYGTGNDTILTINPDTLGYSFYMQDAHCGQIAVDTSTDAIWVTRPDADEVGVYTPSDLAYPDVVNAAAPSAVAVDSLSDAAFVTLPSSNRLMAVDGSTLTSIASVQVGPDPQGVAVDSETGRIYVANSGDGTISVLAEGAPGRVKPSSAINLAVSPVTTAAPENVAVDAGTGMAYVTDSSNDFVYAVNIASGSVSTIAVGAPSDAIAVNEATGIVYVGVGGSSPGIDMIDTAAGNAVSPVYFANVEPSALAVDETTNTIYASSTDPSLSYEAINGEYSFVSFTTSGAGAYTGVAADDSRGTFYVVSDTGRAIDAVDMAADTATAYSLGIPCERVAVNSDTGDVWIAHGSAGLVGQYGATSLNSGTTYNVGAAPWDVAVNPFLNSAYATAPAENLLYEIDGASKTLLGSVQVGLQPHGVAVDVNTGQVLVANHGDGTLSVLDPFRPAPGTDTTPPTISLVSVAPYVVDVGGDTATVLVNATDNVGVTSVTAAGVALTHAYANTWTGTIATDPTKGVHSFSVSASDAAGNVSYSTGQYNTTTVLNVRNEDAYSPLLQSVVKSYVIQLWGRVVSVADANDFTIDDGYGRPIKVTVPGHGLHVGQYVVVRGQLDGGSSYPALESSLSKMAVVQ